MIQRILLVIAGFLFIGSACSPSISDDVIIIATKTATLSHVSPTASLPSPTVLIPITSGPYFTLTREASCYTGPGVGYNFVMILPAGGSFAVIGRNQENTWWRISTDTAVDCWVADQWGTFTGEAASIPITSSRYATQVVTPIPPTQTKNRQVQVEEPTSVPLSTHPPQPTNPPPTQLPPTNPPPSDPLPTIPLPTISLPTDPPATDPPATDPPATDPPATQPPPAIDHPHRACKDGIDNDDDGFTDGDDPQCENNGDNDESQ